MTPVAVVAEFAKILRNLDAWLVKATAYAESKKFDANVLMQARLAPDAFPLGRQIGAACDQAKFTVAYLTGTKAPSHPDTETTIAEIRARIASCLEFVESIGGAAYDGAADRRVSPGFLRGKWLSGADYLTEFATPNFYFHATMAYAILRHNGVELGKLEYIGSLPIRD